METSYRIYNHRMVMRGLAVVIDSCYICYADVKGIKVWNVSYRNRENKHRKNIRRKLCVVCAKEEESK